MARQGIKGDVKVDAVRQEARRNSPYKRGANRERQFAARLEAEGYSVTRSAGSRSPHDLVACCDAFPTTNSQLSKVLYVQVKTDKAGPWGHFGPKDRKLLLDAADKAGATPVLVWWPPHKSPQYFYRHEWPNTTTHTPKSSE